MRPKNLVKVVRIEEVMRIKRPPILNLSRLTYLACIPLRTGVFHHFWGPLLATNEKQKTEHLHFTLFESFYPISWVETLQNL